MKDSLGNRGMTVEAPDAQKIGKSGDPKYICS